jgi:hypothetical protein
MAGDVPPPIARALVHNTHGTFLFIYLFQLQHASKVVKTTVISLPYPSFDLAWNEFFLCCNISQFVFLFKLPSNMARELTTFPNREILWTR